MGVPCVCCVGEDGVWCYCVGIFYGELLMPLMMMLLCVVMVAVCYCCCGVVVVVLLWLLMLLLWLLMLLMMLLLLWKGCEMIWDFKREVNPVFLHCSVHKMGITLSILRIN